SGSHRRDDRRVGPLPCDPVGRRSEDPAEPRESDDHRDDGAEYCAPEGGLEPGGVHVHVTPPSRRPPGPARRAPMGEWCITRIIYIIYIVKKSAGVGAGGARHPGHGATSGAWDTGAPEDER